LVDSNASKNAFQLKVKPIEPIKKLSFDWVCLLVYKKKLVSHFFNVNSFEIERTKRYRHRVVGDL